MWWGSIASCQRFAQPLEPIWCWPSLVLFEINHENILVKFRHEDHEIKSWTRFSFIFTVCAIQDTFNSDFMMLSGCEYCNSPESASRLLVAGFLPLVSLVIDSDLSSLWTLKWFEHRLQVFFRLDVGLPRICYRMEAGTIGSGTLGQAVLPNHFCRDDRNRCVRHDLVLQKPLAFEGSLGLDCWTTGHDGVQWYHDMSIYAAASTLHGHLLLGIAMSKVEALRWFFLCGVWKCLKCCV